MQHANVPRFPSVPEPANNADALFNSVVALKQSVEMILGQRGTERMPHIHVTAEQPPIQHDGDFWLSKGTSTTLNISLNGAWVLVGTLA